MEFTKEDLEEDGAKAKKEKEKNIYIGLDGNTYLDENKLKAANDEWADGLSGEKGSEEVFPQGKGGFLDQLKAGLSKVNPELFKKGNCKQNIKGIEVYIGPDKQQYASLEDWQKSYKQYLVKLGGEQAENPSQPQGQYQHNKDDDQSRYEN